MAGTPIVRASTEDRSLWRLWFGILAPPTAWAVQLVLGDFVTELGCAAGGFDGMRVVVISISVAALGIAVAAFVVSLAGWRRFRPHEDEIHAHRAAFMAVLGMLSSAIFALVIVMGGLVPQLFLTPCGA